jgi:hypothetical protein
VRRGRIIEHVSDPTRLEQRISQHRTVLAWLRYQVGVEERAVRDLQQREPARAGQHRTMVAYLRHQVRVEERTIGELEVEQKRTGVEVRFKLEPKTPAREPHLHRADCWVIPDGKSTIDADRARMTLSERLMGFTVHPCDVCDPVSALDETAGEPKTAS